MELTPAELALIIAGLDAIHVADMCKTAERLRTRVAAELQAQGGFDPVTHKEPR